MLNTVNYTEQPIWEYFGLTFQFPRVSVIYVPSELADEDQFYDESYDQIEDQEASRGSCVVTQLE